MEKLIDGKLYDTDDAEKIATWRNMRDCSNFDYMHETLYRTDSGNWFIHGEGHAKTRYASNNGDMRGFGEDIRTLSEDEAFQWCQRHNQVDVAKEYFADRIEPA